MAAGSQFSRIVAQDFSAGMFSSLAPELIPANGAFDITNGLLNEQNVVYRRGGTSYFSSVPAGSSVRFLWSGTLKHGGEQTLLATDKGIWRIEGGELHALAGAPIPSALCQPCVFQGRLYIPGNPGHSFDGEQFEVVRGGLESAFFATAANHLLAGAGSRVSVSKVPASEGATVEWAEETNYLALPEGVRVTGMVGWRTSVVVFTTMGIYLIGGLVHAAITDEAGNVLWTQDRYSADAVLWGEPGLAAWKGGLVVPCKDDVWLMELGVSSEKGAPFRNISGPIQTAYRAYVAAGYTPGVGVVFNGHYFLPVMNGASVVDLLVCRLEGVNSAGKAEPAWTHLKGYGAELSALATVTSDVEGPLIGATAGVARVLKLAYFEPGATVAQDANGSDIAFELTTRSISTGNLVPNLISKARLSYRLVAGPATVMTLSVGSTPYGAEWDEFNWDEADWAEATGPFEDLGASLPPAKADPEALTPKVWQVRRKLRFARMRIALDGSASQVSIRALELFVRPSGRVI